MNNNYQGYGSNQSNQQGNQGYGGGRQQGNQNRSDIQYNETVIGVTEIPKRGKYHRQMVVSYVEGYDGAGKLKTKGYQFKLQWWAPDNGRWQTSQGTVSKLFPMETLKGVIGDLIKIDQGNFNINNPQGQGNQGNPGGGFQQGGYQQQESSSPPQGGQYQQESAPPGQGNQYQQYAGNNSSDAPGSSYTQEPPPPQPGGRQSPFTDDPY
jgi:hypothetical protein